MSLIEIATAAIESQMEQLAHQIEGEYKAAVTSNLKHPGLSSGRAAGSIHVEKLGDFHYFIGSDDAHLYWFEMGNGSGGIPKSGASKRPMPLTFGTLGSPVGYARWVHNYPGKHVNTEVANRHR